LRFQAVGEKFVRPYLKQKKAEHDGIHLSIHRNNRKLKNKRIPGQASLDPLSKIIRTKKAADMTQAIE
jgi:hypothetical protein